MSIRGKYRLPIALAAMLVVFASTATTVALANPSQPVPQAKPAYLGTNANQARLPSYAFHC